MDPPEIKCQYVHEVSGSETLWVGNPFYEKYKDLRSEMASFLPCHVALIVEYGYLPSENTVSHSCNPWRKARGIMAKNMKCTNPSHMKAETLSYNCKRKTCHGWIRKKTNKNPTQKQPIKTWTCGSCSHEPLCFINTGKVD